jgi:NAD(P)-dependent dehydrogenase (short-subunit alcohol dehydrogenase family)
LEDSLRIAVIGGTGTIGRAVVENLRSDHEVIAIGHTSGEFQVDTSSPASVRELFGKLGSIDAVVSCAGNARFVPLEKLSDDDFEVGIRSKMMGQINLVRYGFATIADGGSFVLTSGILTKEPAPGTAAITPINAAVEGFARAAALELPRGIRVNVISPPWVSETLVSMGMDPAGGMPAAKVAMAYRAALEGNESGAIIDARSFS